LQTGLVLEVQWRRTLPPEAKDAYRYIFSAVELHEGFNFDTPALNDLRVQSQPQPGDSIDRLNLKWDNYHSLFFTHFLLHSSFLLALAGILGVPLGMAYKITCVLGSLLIAGAISYLLLTITDRTSAGLGLGSLALTLFPVQGIHYVVPTNICLGLGLFLIAVVLRTGGKSRWALFGLSAPCLFLHRAGIIYVGIGVLLSIILRYRDNKKQIALDLLPTMAMVLVYMLVTYISPLKMFRLYPMATPADTNYFREVLGNFWVFLNLVGEWFVMHGVIMLPQSLQDYLLFKFSMPVQDMIRNNRVFLFLGSQIVGLGLFLLPWLVRRRPAPARQYLRWIISLCGAVIILPILSAAALILILRAGWLYPPPEKRTSFYLAFATFLLLMFPSLLHVMYIGEAGHPIVRADLTNRLWIPLAVVLAAVFGRGLWWVFKEIRQGSYEFLPWPRRRQGLALGILQPRYVWAIFLVFLVVGYVPRLAQAYEDREVIKYFMLVRQNVEFDPGQLQWLFDHSGPQDIIVYEDDFIRHYFLCHGGLQRRAIFSPLLPLPKDFRYNPGDIKYEVGWNPYLLIQHYENVRHVAYPLHIPGGSVYKLTLTADCQPDALQLLPGGQDGRNSARVRIIRQAAGGPATTRDLTMAGPGWQTVPLSPAPGGSITLINLEPAKPLLLGGLRLGGQANQQFLWPWQGVVHVSLDDKRLGIQRAAFLPTASRINGAAYDLEVVQDRGSTVLWRLRPAPPPAQVAPPEAGRDVPGDHNTPGKTGALITG
jgi:hypothetical protein